LEHNPIYVQLTRHLRSPEKKAFKPLSGAIAVGGSIILIAILVFYGSSIWLTVVMAVGMASIVLIAPVVTLVTSALITGKHAAQDNLVLVQLSGLSEHQIVDGYHAAARQHLRWLRAVRLGVIPSIWLTLFYPAGGDWIITCIATKEFCWMAEDMLIFSVLTPSIGVAIVAALGINLSELALVVGLWLGLTQHKNSLVGAAMVLGGTLLICIVLYASIAMIPYGICGMFLILPLIIFGALPLTHLIHRRTIDAVAQTRTALDTL
jgi:hypothetical protein